MELSKKSLGLYRIVYPEPTETIQYKNLIKHEDFLNVIKPTEEKIAELEKDKSNQSLSIISNLKKILLEDFGEQWFTDKSPLFFAIKSGILSLPKNQGGDLKILIQKIK